jgi:hypothetical protein
MFLVNIRKYYKVKEGQHTLMNLKMVVLLTPIFWCTSTDNIPKISSLM